MTNLERARECFLEMIADATSWERDDDYDGTRYRLNVTFKENVLADFVEALEIPIEPEEFAGDAIDRALAAPAPWEVEEKAKAS
jgi:hypothetical protein